MMRRLLIVIGTLWLTAIPLLAQQAPPGQDGFVPASSLPPTEQIPAPRLLIGSYAAFLALMMFYLWTIWRRIGRVERELQDLDRRTRKSVP